MPEQTSVPPYQSAVIPASARAFLTSDRRTSPAHTTHSAFNLGVLTTISATMCAAHSQLCRLYMSKRQLRSVYGHSTPDNPVYDVKLGLTYEDTPMAAAATHCCSAWQNLQQGILHQSTACCQTAHPQLLAAPMCHFRTHLQCTSPPGIVVTNVADSAWMTNSTPAAIGNCAMPHDEALSQLSQGANAALKNQCHLFPCMHWMD